MDQEKIKQQLTQKLAELEEELANIEDADPSNDELRGLSNSTDDDGDESERGNRASALRRVVERQVHYVKTAIQKIDNGTYGICDLTGDRIPDDRLKAIPWAIYTKEAEEQLERRRNG
ncbi:TraR/DksA C4-type zinc finger protein [candidate division WWE3 bacterium]|uniref:TraR/DksA C4-type zinc finger protein n=1 Tax=candidate division WWE3 bacterium TaxID=2053526 RepID=A0A955LH74_UNCKA|nr:TraR/DksA C4-type zinc finger protein [candidate division WWE3 bacterium]